MNNWKKLFPTRILDRGTKYFYQGNVKSFAFDKDNEHFTAIVDGASPLSYRVRGRLSLQGKASELSCSCPWASKGHRCKHEVAALIMAKSKQNLLNQQDMMRFVDQLPDGVIELVKRSKVVGNPLEIIGDRSYTNDELHTANEFLNRVAISDHEFYFPGNNEYSFIVTFKDGFFTFDVTVDFTNKEIKAIRVNAPYRNFNTRAIEIAGLLMWTKFFVKDNPLEQTNIDARKLLRSFESKDITNTPIILRAQLDTDSNRKFLSFKIGQGTHLYKLKGFMEFLDSVTDGQPVHLGKYFDRPIRVENFDHDSRVWYDFILQLVDSYVTIQNQLDNYYQGDFAQVNITGSIADQIDKILASGVKAYFFKEPLEFKKEELQLPFEIQAASDRTLVTIGSPLKRARDLDNLITGNNHFYGLNLKKGQWLHYDGLRPEFLDKYNLEPGRELQFGSSSMITFGRRVLPQLSKTGSIKVSGEEKLKKYLPKEAKFVIRLDYQNEEITAWPIVIYDDKEYSLLLQHDYPGREVQQEQRVLDAITTYGFDKAKNHYFLSLGDSDKVDDFLDHGIEHLNKVAQVEASNAFKKLINNVKTSFKASLGVQLKDNTLSLSVSGEKLKPEDIQAILSAYQEKKHYFILKNGEVRKINSPSLDELNETMKALGLSLNQFVKGKMAIPAYRAFYLDKQLSAKKDLQYSTNTAFKTVISDLAKNKLKPVNVPAELKNVLRQYQEQGYKWLSTLINYNFGALLADEMGLGKTLQVISVLLARKEMKPRTSLVIAPASVIYNWQHEINKFAPELSSLVLGGTKIERKAQLKQIADYDVAITSYDSLKRDLELYQDLQFDLEVIDEAQNIKNARSAAAKAVKIINGKHRIALTGTPIENNLSELWSIFDYLLPGFLDNYDHFRKTYENPIVNEGNSKVSQKLSTLVAPFVLRRLKKDVLDSLPQKSENIIYATFTGKQKELYDANVQKIIQRLSIGNEQDFQKQRFQVLAELTKLRELCCDPHLLYENYRGKSAKLTKTLDLIQDSLVDGHKILLFSQFTSMLAIIKEKLVKLKLPVFEITGSTPKEKRQELINQFNQLPHPAVFLISLKAGGTGINLTSADVVIHYDPWWNVAAEKQATDRAHRIGQKHKVQIYKIVAKDTIEEQIIELQNRKEKLAEEVLSGEKLGSAILNREDLLKILQR